MASKIHNPCFRCAIKIGGYYVPGIGSKDELSGKWVVLVVYRDLAHNLEFHRELAEKPRPWTRMKFIVEDRLDSILIGAEVEPPQFSL